MTLTTLWIALSVVCGFLGAFLLRRSGRPGVGVLLGTLLAPVRMLVAGFLALPPRVDPHEEERDNRWDGYEARGKVGVADRANTFLDRTRAQRHKAREHRKSPETPHGSLESLTTHVDPLAVRSRASSIVDVARPRA